MAMTSIDTACDEFEASLRDGRCPSIQEYLRRFPDDADELCCQLLQIEVEYVIQQERSGVSESEYQARYPHHHRAVARAFREVRKRFPDAFHNAQEVNVVPATIKVKLSVTSGPSEGLQRTFTNHQTCIVGRAEEAHLRLSKARELSRFHCRIEINPPNIVVVDLQSTNGTKVNGQRVEVASLANGEARGSGFSGERRSGHRWRLRILCFHRRHGWPGDHGIDSHTTQH